MNSNIYLTSALVLFITLLFSSPGTAQDGDVTLGGGLIYGSGIMEDGSSLDNNLGIKVDGYYRINEEFRAGADIGYFFPAEEAGVELNFWELNLNAHYIFVIEEELSAYGLAGLNFANLKTTYEDESGSFSGSNSETGLNLGVGGEYATNFGALFAELKYVVSDADQLVIGAGARFGIN